MDNVNNTFDNNGMQGNEPDQTGSNPKGDSLAFGIASLVCGILALVMSCCITYLGVVLGIIAIVFGIVQIVKNDKKGMAIAGIVCGAIGLVASILLILFSAYLISSGIYDELMQMYPTQ